MRFSVLLGLAVASGAVADEVPEEFQGPWVSHSTYGRSLGQLAVSEESLQLGSNVHPRSAATQVDGAMIFEVPAERQRCPYVRLGPVTLQRPQRVDVLMYARYPTLEAALAEESAIVPSQPDVCEYTQFEQARIEIAFHYVTPSRSMPGWRVGMSSETEAAYAALGLKDGDTITLLDGELPPSTIEGLQPYFTDVDTVTSTVTGSPRGTVTFNSYFGKLRAIADRRPITMVVVRRLSTSVYQNVPLAYEPE